MVIVTFCFYPVGIFAGLIVVLPFLQYVITPTVLLATVFVCAQLTILGVSLRALGRLNNADLMERYCRGDLMPSFVGEKRISTLPPADLVR
jgi:hypothetical protein